MNIQKEITDPTKRYDFLLVYDVTDGNPNGDPDSGNMPRLDPETSHGIVTDVCLKRKIRNYVDLLYGSGYDAVDTDKRFGIFVRDSGVALNTKLKNAAEAVGTKQDKKQEVRDRRDEMCRRYFDVRTFGGVLSTGDYNCGQVRGPFQLTFGRSVDPVVPSNVSITRVAITKEGESKETEMGRKSVLPYGLYISKGYYSPMLAQDTGLDEGDLQIFWRAVANMFENDRSAARGDMRLRQAFIFRHEDRLGNAQAGKLFDRVRAARKEGVEAPRKFSDYDLTVDEQALPEGVSLIRLME